MIDNNLKKVMTQFNILSVLIETSMKKLERIAELRDTLVNAYCLNNTAILRAKAYTFINLLFNF